MAKPLGQKLVDSRSDTHLATTTMAHKWIATFRNIRLPPEQANLTEGDLLFFKAHKTTANKKFQRGFDLVAEALEKGLSSNVLNARALDLRATSRYCQEDMVRAMADINESLPLEPTYVQSMVKRAAFHAYHSDCDLAEKEFDRAMDIKNKDTDACYHRASMCLKTGDIVAAMSNKMMAKGYDDGQGVR